MTTKINITIPARRSILNTHIFTAISKITIIIGNCIYSFSCPFRRTCSFCFFFMISFNLFLTTSTHTLAGKSTHFLSIIALFCVNASKGAGVSTNLRFLNNPQKTKNPRFTISTGKAGAIFKSSYALYPSGF